MDDNTLGHLTSVELRNGHDPEDPEDWPHQHKWLATRLNDLHRVFADRVKRLEI